jgi:heat shock protein 4
MPVMCEMASAMQNIKMRITHLLKIDAVEVLGGTSRIPFMQNIVGDIFGLEPSKTLKSSEAVGRGAAIYGTIEKKFINNYGYEI